MTDPQAEPPLPQQPSLMHEIFLGRDGLRAGWSALLFIAIIGLLAVLTRFVLVLFHHAPTAGAPAPVTLHAMLIAEAVSVAFVLIATFVMARVERRPFTAYGLGGRRKLPLFTAGFICGFTCISVLVAVLQSMHYLTFAAQPVNLHLLLKYGGGWLVAMLLTGFFEETLLRGYLQWTLWRGLGFWWGAVILSLTFGLLHGNNPGESPVGLFSAAAIGLIFCYSVWYTRSLWWAIGLHTAWDWGETYVYGTPNSGFHANGSLLLAQPHGSLLMSGGATGPEGSLLIVPLLLLIAAVVHITLRDHDAAVSVD